MTSEEARRAAWLAERRRAITSNDAACLLGLSTFGGPMDVWLAKVGMAEEQEVTERMTWGLRLQQAILQGYADKRGVAISFADPYQFLRDEELPILGATLDARWTFHGHRPVDAKNVGIKRKGEWGPEGSDQIPEKYLVQLQVQMMVTDTEIADLAVLFGGNKLEYFTVARDELVCDRIREAAEEFWKEHVETRLPPAMDGSAGWAAFVSRLQMTDGSFLKSTPQLDADVLGLQEARRMLEVAEEMEQRYATAIKAFIGSNAGVTGPWGRISWKQNSARRKTDFAAVVVEVNDILAREGRTDLLAKVAQIIEHYSKDAPGVRQFRASITNPNEEEQP
jgi:putative phage-type endonuclease